jgi:glycosyltransferase involved in cell wall biosynthesis
MTSTRNTGSRPTVGVFIVAKNEQRDLPNALASVAWCDQIVVVDMASTDKTAEIARSHGAEVFPFPDVGYVEPALQFATEKVTTDFVLRLDADEIVNLELQQILLRETSRGEYEVFFLRRKNYIFGSYSPNNRYYKDRQLRFWRRGAVTHTDRIHTHPLVHSRKVYSAPEGDVACIVHFNQRTIYEYLDKMNRYTEKEPYDHLKFRGFFYEFFVRYFAKLCYLVLANLSFRSKNDLTVEFLTSTYHFVKYLKSIERQRNQDVAAEYKRVADEEIRRIRQTDAFIEREKP